jgi:hypothetical protein
VPGLLSLPSFADGLPGSPGGLPSFSIFQKNFFAVAVFAVFPA